MRKLNWNSVFLGLGILLLVVLASTQANQENYIETWYAKSKQPFGGYALHQVLEDYQQGKVQTVLQPLHKSYAQGNLQGNLFLIGHKLQLTAADWWVLKDHASKGHQVILAAYDYPKILRDSLNLRVEEFNTQWLRNRNLQELLELEVIFNYVDSLNYPLEPHRISAKASGYQFSDEISPFFDSIYPHHVLAKNQNYKEVLRSYPMGKGEIIVSANPLLFSNYFLLQKRSKAYTQGIFSLLQPSAQSQHYEYYQLGALESGSPLRVLLSKPAMRSALYICLAAIVLYFLFAAKRRQRAIPVLQAPTNQSLEFVKTLGSLHYSTRNYQSLYQKRWLFFVNHVFKHYHIRLNAQETSAWRDLKAKSQAPAELIDALEKSFKSQNGPVKMEALNQQEKLLAQFYSF